MPPRTPQDAGPEASHHKKYSPQSPSKTFDRLFRKLPHGTTDLKSSSQTGASQDNSADLILYRETEHTDLVSRSLPSTSRAIDQGIGAILQDAHHFSISGNARIVNIGQQVNNRNAHSLDALEKYVSFSALHDSSAQDPERRCHPDTREDVLDQIRNWADNPNRLERILWLHGPAGIGKSAIAQTISYSYGRDKVGATFFFFRSDPIRNDGNRLFPTLVWQLALSVPDVKDLIAFSLEAYPDLPRKAIEIQFEQLIAQPFLTLSGCEYVVPTSTRVIIIDGLDECTDVKLQERILKIIGNIVADTCFQLRFLISSRPEAHIQDIFDQFRYPTLQIDLANVDRAFHGIRKYLTSEFSRIAVEQQLDPMTWPSRGIIDTLVAKSSGQFIYASTVIKYVGDKNECAVAQLNVILGLKPSAGESPFSELDTLYREILQRQPDQIFLKDFLAVLIARIALAGKFENGTFHEDDALLLGLNEKQLHRKLRGMRSLLMSKPFIDVHHKSFLDFLDDSSRSGEYHVSKHIANKRYMELITGALVAVASKAIEITVSHEGDHFKPRFSIVTKFFPLEIELPLNDLVAILWPLRFIKERLLQLPNMSVPWKPSACDECWTFHIIDDLLLHLAWFRGTTQLQEPKYVGIRPLTEMEKNPRISQLDLDPCLSSLLASLRIEESNLTLNVYTICLVRALVRFDPTETAMKVRSIKDAQNLVELIFCLNKNQCFKSWFGAAAHNATRLALAIYGRVPLLPRSLFLNSADFDEDKVTYQGKAVEIWKCDVSVRRECFDAFMWGSLSHGNMGPLLGIYSCRSCMLEVSPLPENGTLREWRRNTDPSVSKIQQIVFEVAKAIQYVHSLDIVLRFYFSADDIYLDSANHVKVQTAGFRPNDLSKGQFDYGDYTMSSFTLEANIYWFGILFYEVLLDHDYSESEFKIRVKDVPEIPDKVWQLIQWCCADFPKNRPTIDQVVGEMESWISIQKMCARSS